MGYAAPRPTLNLTTATNFPRARGGSLRSGAQSAIFAALFFSGLYLWLQQDSLVLWLHVVGGIVLAALAAPWLWRHVPCAQAHSKRPVFGRISWALLASWLILVGSGLALVLPAGLWLAGWVWFPPRAVFEALSFAHFWTAWLAMAGLILHLAMRHWLLGPK